MTGRPRLLLGLAAIAVAFAAADTYVVVLALPDMMNSVGIPIDQLQRAAPIVSGFLLGYVAMLPLIGRIADLRPAERRGVPLGVVSAVQELGSVLGPLFGALVLAVADWRAIFLVNLAVGLVLAAAIRAAASPRP